MAGMVSSAVAQETINQVVSTIKERYDSESNTKEHMERIKMAHVKLQVALETSEKWNITIVPLLRWRSKLKCAVQECDDALRSCKKRLQEQEEMEHGVRSSSFPRRFAYTARSLVSSIFNRGNNELSGSMVRRFEWFADSASEFLRYVELGGTPRRYMFFEPLVRHLLTGKATKYYFARGSQHLIFFLRPFILPEHGIEGGLIFLFEDGIAPESNFILALHLRLSESTDIVGVIVRCLQLFKPHFRSTTETVKTKLTQLPTQDFYWVPYSITSRKEHWENLHTIFCQWSRPNRHCCQQYDHHYAQSYAGSSTSTSPGHLPCDDIYMEPVTEVYLQGHVALSSGRKKRRVVVNGETCPTRDFPYLKLAGLFSPHAPSEDLPPAVGGSATETINKESAHCGLYANISFQQLGEIMLPKAVDCLQGNAAATTYQMLWKSKHGGAYFRVEETSSWRETNRKCRGRKSKKLRGKKLQEGTSGMAEFMGSWVAHAPAQLQGSITSWLKKEKQMLPLEDEVTPMPMV